MDFSPYHYSFDNPMRFSDPDGRWAGENLWKGIKNWLNKPISRNAQVVGRGAMISGTGMDVTPQTRGELGIAIAGHVGRAVGGSRPGSFRFPNTRSTTLKTNSSSSQSNASASNSNGYVFRGDSRAPSEIFKSGFKSKGDNMNLFDHTLNNPDNSGYVSTSTKSNVSRVFADEGGFVYTIKRPANGIDVNKTLGNNSPFPHELEIAVPGGVAGSLILGARQVGPKGKFEGPYIKNQDTE